MGSLNDLHDEYRETYHGGQGPQQPKDKLLHDNGIASGVTLDPLWYQTRDHRRDVRERYKDPHELQIIYVILIDRRPPGALLSGIVHTTIRSIHTERQYHYCDQYPVSGEGLWDRGLHHPRSEHKGG